MNTIKMLTSVDNITMDFPSIVSENGNLYRVTLDLD